MILFISTLSTDEEAKAKLINAGFIEHVGFIELGMCPKCESSIGTFATVEEKTLFDKTGICSSCQKKTHKSVKEIFDKYIKYLALPSS
jgi:hypothetical protein